VWSRRDVLGALGGAAASTILWACRPAAGTLVTPRIDIAESFRQRLRDAVARLSGAFAEATVLASVRTHTVATADAGGRAVRAEIATSLVLSAKDATGRRFERITADVTTDGIDAAVLALLDGRTPRGWSGTFGSAADGPEPPAADDPARAHAADFTRAADELYARALAGGSSRVVYRAGYVEIDDSSVWFVGSQRDAYQRLVRGRAGAMFVAWSGARPSVGLAEAAGPIGLAAAARVSDADIAAAAAHAVELMTPGAAPDGDVAVVLDPSVTAAVIEAAVADVMTADGWRRPDLAARAAWTASPMLTVADDPGVACYGGYVFADDGRDAARQVLIDRGAPQAPLAAARRPGYVGVARAAAGHVVVDPGERTRDDLFAAARTGLLVEDAGVARVDPVRWDVVVPVGRARRIDGGRRTGHVYADLEVRAPVPALLGAIAGVSHDVQAFARRAVVDGEPLWRSTSAPAVLTRAHVAPRTRRAG
jgi:predicted Zn-dependent protease